MRNTIIRDLRHKEKFQVDDAYLNGYARHLGLAATAVYFSLCRHANKEQQCFPSLKLLAEEHGISTKTVQRAIKKLQEYNIIYCERTKSKSGKWLNNTYYLLDKSVWKPVENYDNMSSFNENEKTIRHQCPAEKPQDISAETIGHFSPIKDTHIKDTHITPPLVFSPPKKHSSLKKYSSLKDITPQDLLEISEKYKIPVGFVKLTLEKMTNWLEAKGRRYKNYKRALMNWVLKEAEERISRQQKGGFVDASEI